MINYDVDYTKEINPDFFNKNTNSSVNEETPLSSNKETTSSVNEETTSSFNKEKDKNKIAIFCGSFDPFTNGHLSIVKKASQLFDVLYVVVADNGFKKKRTTNQFEMKRAIEQTLKKEGITNCIVDCVYKLIADYCQEYNIKYIVRGLRNNMDYNYEENIAEVNSLLNPNLEYVYFRADDKAISSSMVKELLAYNCDVSNWIPKDVLSSMKY